MKTAKITIDGHELVIKELRHRKNSVWRKKLTGPLQKVTTMLAKGADTELDMTNIPGLIETLKSIGLTVLNSTDIICELLIEYAPEHQHVFEEAYDSELLEAFVEVLKLAYPFGQALTYLRQIGSNLASMSPNLPEVSGDVGTTSSPKIK